MGVQGLQVHPQKFWFAENLGKSPENWGKNGIQCCMTSKNAAQCLHGNTRDLILKVTPKRGLHDLCGRKFIGKSCTKTFRACLGKFGQNFAPQKFACFYIYDEKSPPPYCPSFERAEGKRSPPMPPFSGASVHIILHALSTRCCSMQCVTAMNINYQRSHKTEQLIPANISGNALKQGSRTHSVLCQRSSQLQNYNAARMFCRIAVDQKVCGWDGGHPGLTV